MTQECQDLVCLVWSHNPACVWSKVPSVYLDGPLCSGCLIGKWTDANWPENLENAQVFSSACLGWWLSVAFIHRNRRLNRDGSLGLAPRLSHSSWAMKQHVFCLVVQLICGQKKYGLAPSMSPSRCPHVGWLFTNKDQKRLAWDIFNALASQSHAGLVDDITDTDCWAENDSAQLRFHNFQISDFNLEDKRIVFETVAGVYIYLLHDCR